MKILGLLTIVWSVFELAYGSTLNILDQSDESVSIIAEHVCWHTYGTSKQISKVSTVTKIADYLSSLPVNHKLAACSELYLDSIRDLANLVSISNDNVCSAHKISAIQKFHGAYILLGSQLVGKAPKILTNFFIHYANSVSQVCATETASFLKAINSTPQKNTIELDKLLADLAEKTGVSAWSNLQYEDIFLLWTIVDILPLDNLDNMNKYLFQGEKRVVMAAKNPRGFFKMQDFCRTRVKPLYSYSLLSTIKLIDIGYYPVDSRIVDQLNSNNRQARRFYELTRICEALLPVRIVQQQMQMDSEIVLLSRQEVKDLGLSVEGTSEPETIENVCKRCSMASVDALGFVTKEDAIPVVKHVKSNIRSRKSAFSRLLKIFIKNTSSNVVANLKKLFGGKTPEGIESVDENQLNIYELPEVYEEEDVLSDGSLRRSKRGLSLVLSTIAKRFMQITLFLLYMVWVFVTIFILYPLTFLYLLFSFISGLENAKLEDSLLKGGGVFY